MIYAVVIWLIGVVVVVEYLYQLVWRVKNPPQANFDDEEDSADWWKRGEQPNFGEYGSGD